MLKGVKHYFRDGTEHKGGTHKDAKGRLMSGSRHTATSKFLYHKEELMKMKRKKPAKKPMKKSPKKY
jgi:predicted  nucleic acid-binding Zn-ribbon protein